MDINAKSVFLGMKHAIPEMEKAGAGAIVNISSISGFVGQEAIHPGYNASKGAVRLVTKAAAVQHAKSGIRVNSVHPGMMPPMLTSFQRGDAKREAMMDAVPMGREGEPIEVATPCCSWPRTRHRTSPARSCWWTAGSPPNNQMDRRLDE